MCVISDLAECMANFIAKLQSCVIDCKQCGWLNGHRSAVYQQSAPYSMQNPAGPSSLLVCLQDCSLKGIPTQLGAATALRRLRITNDDASLRITLADLDMLSALRSMTFLSATQAGPCNDRPAHRCCSMLKNCAQLQSRPKP
jgi:hypothetical protein